MIILIISILITLYGILSFILSFISFMDYKLAKSTYYNSLKKDIINTNTYEEFLNRRKNKR